MNKLINRIIILASSILILGCGSSDNDSADNEVLKYVKDTDYMAFDYYEANIEGKPIMTEADREGNMFVKHSLYLSSDGMQTCHYFYYYSWTSLTSSYYNSSTSISDTCDYSFDGNNMIVNYKMEDMTNDRTETYTFGDWYNKEARSFKLYVNDDFFIGTEK